MTAEDREKTLEPGRTLLDRYVVDERIGAGASSVVYSGRQLSTGQKVAIKVLRTRVIDTVEGEANAAKRFTRELQLSAQLSHPHIVRLIDAGTLESGVVFTVFEHIHGASLSEVLKSEGPLSALESKRLMLQALDALSAAHALNIVHRDVKPSNMMVTKRGAQRNLLLLDFGIATVVEGARDADFAAVTGSNAFPGTPAYAPREQIRGASPTPKSDLYAWGLVFLECLTGRRAISGSSVADVLMQQLDASPVPIPPPLLAHPLGRILHRAVAKDVEHRYASAEQVFLELERCDVTDLEPGETIDPAMTRPIRAVAEPTKELRTTGSSPERRQVTALFASLEDVRGDTGEALEPEDLAELLKAARASAESIALKHGATLAPSRADEMLAYFGYPSAAEDAAYRAVLAALSIAHAAPSVHIAVHTGVVIVDPQASTADLVGETAATAERAAAHADHGGVVVTAAAKRLIEARFEVEPKIEAVLRRGEAPTALFTVLRELEQRRRPARAALVGRERELRLLQERFQEAKAGVGQAALLIGEPGIGKSRLVEELCERIAGEPHLFLDARCVAERADAPMHPFIELLEAQLGTPDEAGDRLAALERFLERLGLPLDEAGPLLASLLSVPFEHRWPRPVLSARGLRERTMELAAACFALLAEKQTLVLVIEDLHWADPSSLELLERVITAGRGVPLFVLLTSRPVQRAPWTGSLLQIRLNRLSYAETAKLISSLSAAELSEDSLSAIRDRSDGVPLFVEELTLMVAEVKEGARTLPMTLRDSLAARLDLVGEARRTALLASTLGRELEYGVLRAVSPLSDEDLKRDLGRLLDAELLFQKGLIPHARFVFKHSLIQEAAYESLVKTSKKNYHLNIAETLETKFPDVARGQPETLAHHYARAGRTKDAVRHIVTAGRKALSRSANQEAMSFVDRGLGWVREGGDDGSQTTQELQLQAVLIPALFASKGYASPEVARALERSNVLVAKTGDTPHSFPIRWGIWVYYTVRGRHLEAVEMARRLMHVAEEAKQPDLILESHVALGHSLYYLPDLKSGCRHLERVLELYDAEKHASHAQIYGQDPALVAYAFLSSMYWLRGQCDRALELLGKGRALAMKLKHAYSTDFILGLSAVQFQLRREPSEALAAASELSKSARTHVHPFWSAIADILAGWARVRLGEKSMEQISAGIDAFRATGARNNLPYDLALLAEAQAGTGDHASAIATLDEAIEVYEDTGERRLEAEIHRLRAESTAAISGEWTEAAIEELERAADVARQHGSLSLELRVAMSLSKALASRGDATSARARLQQIYEALPEGRDTPDQIEARAMLAQ